MKTKFLAPAMLAALTLFCSCQRNASCSAYKKSKQKPRFDQTFLTDTRR